MPKVAIIKLTGENREEVSNAVKSMYFGEECQGCNETFETLDDLKQAVWWPWEKGRIGHKDCFKKHVKGE